MALNITIDDIEIKEWTVDLLRQSVHIQYTLTAGGVEWRVEDATFWVVLPNDPVDGHDFQLPVAYAQDLLNLTNDAEAMLRTHWNI